MMKYLIVLSLLVSATALAGPSYSPNNVRSDGADQRLVRATIANNGTTCSVTSQSGTWITSTTRAATGNCTYVWVFTATPTCQCTANSNNRDLCTWSTSPTTTGGGTLISTNAGVSDDRDINVTCMGTK